jgi:hypothetical protein
VLKIELELWVAELTHWQPELSEGGFGVCQGCELSPFRRTLPMFNELPHAVLHALLARIGRYAHELAEDLLEVASEQHASTRSDQERWASDAAASAAAEADSVSAVERELVENESLLCRAAQLHVDPKIDCLARASVDQLCEYER